MAEVTSGSVLLLLREAGRLAADQQIGLSESLFDSGILDSLVLVDLVLALERRYGVRVQDDELLPENFDTITNLCAYIGGKLEERSEAVPASL